MSLQYLNPQFIYIDSHNRSSGTHGDFEIPVNIKNLDVDSVVCIRATIKKSYYLVENGSNTFTLQEDAQTATITIPEGNYSASSFRIVLQTQLNSSSPHGWTYSISLPNTAISASTGKYTYTVTGNTSQPSFILTTFLYEQLGFESNTTNTFTSNTLTSMNVLNFQLKDVVRIHTDMIGGDIKDNILQEVSCLSNDFSALKYECFDIEANTKSLKNSVSNKFHFVILDEDYNKLNLSLNVLITLMVYKRNDIADKANRQNIEYLNYLTLSKIKK